MDDLGVILDRIQMDVTRFELANSTALVRLFFLLGFRFGLKAESRIVAIFASCPRR